MVTKIYISGKISGIENEAPELFAKAEKTGKIVRQNLMIATFAIIGASLPALCGVVPLWLAVILHEGGTVIVGLNATRLLKD